MDMKRYGLTESLAAEAARHPGKYVGRVVSQHKTLYRAVCENGELAAEVSGRFRYEAASASEFPAVGDFVLLDRDSGERGNAVIHDVMPRKSAFIRRAAGTSNGEQVVAANIDKVFICMALDHDFNLRRLERYLTVGWDSGAAPVVVLTKADLCEDIEGKLAEAKETAAGAEVLATSSLATDGYTQVRRYIRDGETVAFIGSSGVGKSTLINRLLGEDKLGTGGIRNDGRGRHTTTSRELLLLPGGGLVVDTPGMRELGMWEVSEGIDRAFADIEALFAACRFADCRHAGEPGCAVRAAIEKGELSPERWLSYQKLRKEAGFYEDTAGAIAKKERKFKSIAKANKNNKKN